MCYFTDAAQKHELGATNHDFAQESIRVELKGMFALVERKFPREPQEGMICAGIKRSRIPLSCSFHMGIINKHTAQIPVL